MLKCIIEKELRAILKSPKFPATFAVSAVLILLSIMIGLREYHTAVRNYESATQLVNQEMSEATSWMGISNSVFRRPDPMQIFVSGVDYDIGRFSAISPWEEIKLRRSRFSDDPLFALFRLIDFTFIVKVAFSLLAILFTYDAISGERERGTLQLTFSNPVPRAIYILGKFTGAWLGLVIPVLLPILLGLLIVLLYQVPFTITHWVAIALLLGGSLLYFSFFIAFGICISAWTRNATTAFLVLLVSWVVLTLIVPRIGSMIAGQMVDTPTVAEIESRQGKYAQERWETSMREVEARISERNQAMNGMDSDEREAYQDEHMWDWLQTDDAGRKSVQKDISEHHRRLMEDLRNREAVQERLALGMSRLSPAATYQLAMMNLAGTDPHLKTRYEDAMHQYRERFVDFAEKKQEGSGHSGGIRISIDTDQGINVSAGEDAGSLDLGELPKFNPPGSLLSGHRPALLIDFGLLALYTLLAVAGGFTGFLRYDVR